MKLPPATRSRSSLASALLDATIEAPGGGSYRPPSPLGTNPGRFQPAKNQSHLPLYRRRGLAAATLFLVAALGSGPARFGTRPSLELRPQSCLMAATRGLGRPGVRPCPCCCTRHRPRRHPFAPLRSDAACSSPPTASFCGSRCSGSRSVGGGQEPRDLGPPQTSLEVARRERRKRGGHLLGTS